MNSCIDKCDLPKNPDEIYVMLKQIKKEILNFYNDTTKSLLHHDEKITELCNYLKDNLGSSVQLLIDSMVENGEIDELIRRVLLTNDPINVKDFGAVR